MAKTKPIGVRFDEDLLKILQTGDESITPQAALSLYEQYFRKEISLVKDNNSLSPILIYSLKDPTTGQVFYVGRTCFGLNKRLGLHISQINSTSTHEHLNHRKIDKIKGIINSGLKPIIELIEEIKPETEDEYRGFHERESFWIAQYISLGHPLTNKLTHLIKDLINSIRKNNEPENKKKIEEERKGYFDRNIEYVKELTVEQIQEYKRTIEVPNNLQELKLLCPKELTGFDRSQWISEQRQKYNL